MTFSAPRIWDQRRSRQCPKPEASGPVSEAGPWLAMKAEGPRGGVTEGNMAEKGGVFPPSLGPSPLAVQ